MTKKPLIGTATLDYPIQDGDKLITEITLRRVNVGDMEDANMLENESSQGTFLLSRLSGLSENIIRQLDRDDGDKLGLMVAKARGKFLETSENA